MNVYFSIALIMCILKLFQLTGITVAAIVDGQYLPGRHMKIIDSFGPKMCAKKCLRMPACL